MLERLTEMQNAHGKNRLVVILDGMGVSIVKKLLDENGFFNRNMTDVESAIIPATTVAATTAYRTGKMPWETGFIGWRVLLNCVIRKQMHIFTHIGHSLILRCVIRWTHHRV